MNKHKHAELMVLYAQDAMETDEPWERWESRKCENNVWSDLDNHPCWFTHREYRRKQRTININGYEVPEPLREIPEDAGHVYEVDFYTGVKCLEAALRNGFVHATKEAAELHAEALLSFTKQQTDQQ